MRCDVCGRFRRDSDLEQVTVLIHYSMGPVFQIICTDCREKEECNFDAGFRARSNETTQKAGA